MTTSKNLNNDIIKILDSRQSSTIVDFLRSLPQSRSEYFLNRLSTDKRTNVLNEITRESTVLKEQKLNLQQAERQCPDCKFAPAPAFNLPTVDFSAVLKALLVNASPKDITSISLVQYSPGDVVKALLDLSPVDLAKVLLNLSPADLAKVLNEFPADKHLEVLNKLPANTRTDILNRIQTSHS